jgi:hypothetical protein
MAGILAQNRVTPDRHQQRDFKTWPAFRSQRLCKLARRRGYSRAAAMPGSKRSPSTVVKVTEALTRERRKNRRLRAVIDALGEQIAANRRDLDLQFTRLAQLQAEVDTLKSRRG